MVQIQDAFHSMRICFKCFMRMNLRNLILNKSSFSSVVCAHLMAFAKFPLKYSGKKSLNPFHAAGFLKFRR